MSDQAPAPSLFRKLAGVMGEVGHVEAKGYNEFLGAKYVKEGDLVNAIRDKLASRNVVMIPGTTGTFAERAVKVGKAQKDSVVVTVGFRYTFCDGDTGETFTTEWAGAGEDPTDKALVMAGTSALRTFLLKTFLVSSEEQPANAVPRAPTTGGVPLTDDQYDGILETFKEKGEPSKSLLEVLDEMSVVTEVAGTFLTPSQRIKTLNTTEAITLHKKLAALPKPEALPA